MIVFLTGVLVTQQEPRSGVPRNASAALSFPLGADVTVKLRVVDSVGAPVTLTGGVTGVLTIKRRPGDVEKILSVAGNVPAGQEAGTMDFAISAAAQKTAFALGPGQVFYDVWITRAGQRDAVIPVSPLYVTPAVAPIP